MSISSRSSSTVRSTSFPRRRGGFTTLIGLCGGSGNPVSTQPTCCRCACADLSHRHLAFSVRFVANRSWRRSYSPYRIVWSPLYCPGASRSSIPLGRLLVMSPSSLSHMFRVLTHFATSSATSRRPCPPQTLPGCPSRHS